MVSSRTFVRKARQWLAGAIFSPPLPVFVDGALIAALFPALADFFRRFGVGLFTHFGSPYASELSTMYSTQTTAAPSVAAVPDKAGEQVISASTVATTAEDAPTAASYKEKPAITPGPLESVPAVMFTLFFINALVVMCIAFT